MVITIYVITNTPFNDVSMVIKALNGIPNVLGYGSFSNS